MGISYGQCYHTRAETTIVTLPIGYADGWSRALSGKARVLINGEYYPVVGTICMDQCMVDVGDAPVQVGDEVVLIGEQKGEGDHGGRGRRAPEHHQLRGGLSDQ